MSQQDERGLEALIELLAVIGAGYAFAQWQDSASGGWAFALALAILAPNRTVFVRWYQEAGASSPRPTDTRGEDK